MFGWFKEWRKGSCVARALYQGAAWKYDYKEDVRFIVKNISKGVDHIQAQGYDEKRAEWRWLTMHGDVVDYGRDEYPDARTLKILTFKQFLQERVEAENDNGAKQAG